LVEHQINQTQGNAMTIAAVYDPLGQKKILAPMLASGGEGEVYPLVERSEILVKIYHAEVLQKRGTDLKGKTEAMIGLKNSFVTQAVSWPLLSVFDDRKNWVGYAMRRANGVPMARLAHAMAYQKSFPKLDRGQVLGYLLSLLRAVQSLHRAGVRVGDYSRRLKNQWRCHKPGGW
jgi:DNA-binding helix-hairpin-helix protein with protein kinase domain